MKKMKRREFFKKGSTAAIIGSSSLIFGCNSQQTGEGPAIISNKKFNWNLVTSWPPHFPVMGEGVDRMAAQIDTMSGGRLKIQVYGGGEIVPPLEVFDAVSQGSAQMGHSAAYYWGGKVPAGQFFTAVPFGMNAQQMYSWLYFGGGLELWEEAYAPFNLLPIPAGTTGMQMGGWFNKKINSAADLKGLKMRIPGFGGKVVAKAGGSPIQSAAGEIYTNLERGVIDAAEWVGPYHDYLMGFHRIAKYCYYPGWHEPGPILELMVNKLAWESLPQDLQAIVRTAATNLNVQMISEFESQNYTYLKKIREESKATVLKFPDEVLKTLKKYSDEVIEELIASDAMSAKTYESFSSFQKNIAGWAEVSEKVYYGQFGGI